MAEWNVSGYRFSESDVKKVLTTLEGKKLLQLLNRDGERCSRWGIRMRARALLEALKPYCSEERQGRIARLSRIAGAALRSMEKKE